MKRYRDPDNPYGLKPRRSIVFRAKLARNLVKLASRIDGRPNVKYSIAHHHPLGWTTTR